MRAAFLAALAAAVLAVGITGSRAETCVASHYGAESGRYTANGEHFRPNGLTVAMRSHHLGDRYRVCYHGCTVVRHNDFGPATWTGRCADLSTGAARAIGLSGTGAVRIVRIK